MNFLVTKNKRNFISLPICTRNSDLWLWSSVLPCRIRCWSRIRKLRASTKRIGTNGEQFVSGTFLNIIKNLIEKEIFVGWICAVILFYSCWIFQTRKWVLVKQYPRTLVIWWVCYQFTYPTANTERTEHCNHQVSTLFSAVFWSSNKSGNLLYKTSTHKASPG